MSALCQCASVSLQALVAHDYTCLPCLQDPALTCVLSMRSLCYAQNPATTLFALTSTDNDSGRGHNWPRSKKQSRKVAMRSTGRFMRVLQPEDHGEDWVTK